VLVATGCRRSELGLATFGDARLHLDQGMLLLANSKTVKRVVPLDGQAEKSLRRWLRNNPEAKDTDSLWNVVLAPELIARTVKRYSNGMLTTHSIRRWFVSRWLKRGGSMVSLGRLCGWSPATTSTMATIYSRSVGTEVMVEEYRRIL
jgi:integrase